MPAKPTTTPYSAEAEEHVLACCLIDNGFTLERCLTERIGEESFYFPANKIIWNTMLSLHAMDVEISLPTLIEELGATKNVETVGGLPYLMQLTDKAPTTAHAGYFIEKVRQKQVVREIIKASTDAIAKAQEFNGDLSEFTAEVEKNLLAITQDVGSTSLKAKPLTEFAMPPENDRSVLLGTDRYLNRGDGMLMVSTSGMGKSSMSIQMATGWARGRAVFGIPCNGELKSLIIQAEDSDGDVAEVMLSIAHQEKWTDEDKAKVKKNVIVVKDRIHRGDTFIAALRSLVRQHKPDLVWINPLLAFVDGDSTKADVMGKFLREGLNRLNNDESFAFVIVHHTPKPPTQEKNRGVKKWNEVMYGGAGSADLTNWARAIVVLEAEKTEGEFTLHLAKRGKRAGVVERVEQGAGERLETITAIPLQHCRERMTMEGRKGTVPVIYWLPRAKDVDDAEPEDLPDDGERELTPEECRALSSYPRSFDEPETLAQIARNAREHSFTPKRMLEIHDNILSPRAFVERTSDNRYRRTEAGDQLV